MEREDVKFKISKKKKGKKNSLSNIITNFGDRKEIEKTKDSLSNRRGRLKRKSSNWGNGWRNVKSKKGTCR